MMILLFKMMILLCKNDDFPGRDARRVRVNALKYRQSWWVKLMNCVSKTRNCVSIMMNLQCRSGGGFMTRQRYNGFRAEVDGFCTGNDGLHATNDGFHTENDEFHAKNDEFHRASPRRSVFIYILMRFWSQVLMSFWSQFFCLLLGAILRAV